MLSLRQAAPPSGALFFRSLGASQAVNVARLLLFLGAFMTGAHNAQAGPGLQAPTVQSYQFTATGIYSSSSLGESPPQTSLSGAFSLAYDPNQSVVGQALNTISLTIAGYTYTPSNTAFNYDPTFGSFLVTGKLNGATVAAGTNDFFLTFSRDLFFGGGLAYTTSSTSSIFEAHTFDPPSNVQLSLATPPPPPAGAPPKMDFLLPLRGTNASTTYEIITQIGGSSSDPRILTTQCGVSQPYADPCHTNGGYYSLDLKPIIKGTTAPADVVAAASGVVVFSGLVGGTPGLVIYNGNGYFTEYLEFSAATIGPGWVDRGQTIGTYLDSNTSALHFQVKYNDALKDVPATTYADYLVAQSAFLAANSSNPSSVCSGAATAYAKCLNLSSNTAEPQRTALSSVTLQGSPLSDYALRTTTSCVSGFSVCPQATDVPTAKQPNTPLPLIGFLAIDTTIAGSTAQMAEHSPAYLWSQVTIPQNAEFIAFEYFWDNKGDGDYLSVTFNGTLLFNYLGTNFDGSDFILANLPIWQYSGQTGDLSFILNSVGDPNAVVRIRNMGFYTTVPETPIPSSILLFGSGIVILISLKRAQCGLFKFNSSRSSHGRS